MCVCSKCIPCTDSDGDLKAVYLPDGTIDNGDSDSGVVIPEGIHHHIDTYFANADINSEDSLLGFVYEAGNEYFTVYTSEEAEELCEVNPFESDSEVNPFESDSEVNPFESDSDDIDSISQVDPVCHSPFSEGQFYTQPSKLHIELSQQHVIADEEFMYEDLIGFDSDDFVEYLECTDSDIDSDSM